MVRLNRRDVLIAGAGAGVATLAAVPGHARMLSPHARPAIAPVDYADVTLADGPAVRLRGTIMDNLLAMDEDALLRPFRLAAGLPAPGPAFGGWYDPSPHFAPVKDMRGFIPGHSFGQYMSSLARGYAVTGDVRLQAKVHRLVSAFGAIGTKDFYRDYPLPGYTYDKILIGLIDAYRYTGSAEARALIAPATADVLSWLPERALDRNNPADQATRPQTNLAFTWDETYTLPENLYLAHDLGLGSSFDGLARRFDLASYFGALAAGNNVLPERHAYSHVNALASSLALYRHGAGDNYLAAARNGMQFVLDQSFATGGWGPDEFFIKPGSGGLGDSLGHSHASFEAPCGTFGHFKVGLGLICATGESHWGDSMERLLYNAAFGLLPVKSDGVAFYYADYNEYGGKYYYDQACPCCSGSIGQLFADIGRNAYLQDASGLYVNFYLPSTVQWHQGRGASVSLTQAGGDYPVGNRVAMRVTASKPTTMALRLRIPAWAGPKTILMVNGKPQALAGAGHFTTLTRTWSDDVIELAFDMSQRLEPVDSQHPDRVALMSGPLALFATGERLMTLPRDVLLTAQRKVGGSDWEVSGIADAPVFKPFFAIGGERTRLYQSVV